MISFQPASITTTALSSTNNSAPTTTSTTTTAAPLGASLNSSSSNQIDSAAMDAYISTIIESPPIHYISYSRPDNIVGYKPPFDNQPFDVQSSNSDISSMEIISFSSQQKLLSNRDEIIFL